MRVLIITHIFWPEAADFRNLPLATGLAEKGHEVTVLTAFPNYPFGRIYDGYKLSWRKWERREGIRILRVPLYPDHSSSGLKRILNYLSFTVCASSIGLMLVGEVDVIFVHSPPMTLGVTAGLFKLFHRCPILLDVVDLWPDAIIGSGMASSALVTKFAALAARSAYSLSDRISVLTEGYASRLRAAGVRDEKLLVMPPWTDGNIYKTVEKNREFGKAHSLEGKFCIIHAGNIGPFQDIRNVLSAAEKVRHIDNLRIVLVGGGRDIGEMQKEKQVRGLDNVVFAGSYPAEQMPGILAWGNALLVSLRSDPYLSINLPSKMPGYMAVGRPILVCADGEARDLVLRNNLGLCCKPGDPAALADAFARFMTLPENERRDMGERSRRLFERSFDKDALIEEYISQLEDMSRNYRVSESD